jgi:hypothetical protein
LGVLFTEAKGKTKSWWVVALLRCVVCKLVVDCQRRLEGVPCRDVGFGSLHFNEGAIPDFTSIVVLSIVGNQYYLKLTSSLPITKV